ncbi:MAG: response regulator [Dehalococcoidia bacterium]|nr:response regulator [Dehalococcoidia bacterium]
MLVVDDEAAVQDVIARTFRKRGYEVLLASCGDEAMAMAREEKFDVYLLDIRMPGMDGLELLGEIRHLCPDAMAIILTAQDGEENNLKAKAIDLGAFAYLNKPCSLKDVEDTIERAYQQVPAVPSKRLIMLVDDEAVIREVASRGLTKRGYDVVTASCGEEAIECAKRREFDAYVLDIRMPRMNGLEVLRIIKSMYPDAIVIMLTAVIDSEMRTECTAIDLGAFAYLNKPCGANEIDDALKRAFASESNAWARV